MNKIFLKRILPIFGVGKFAIVMTAGALEESKILPFS